MFLCDLSKCSRIIQKFLRAGGDQVLNGLQLLLCLARQQGIPYQENQQNDRDDGQRDRDQEGITQPKAGTEGFEHGIKFALRLHRKTTGSAQGER